MAMRADNGLARCTLGDGVQLPTVLGSFSSLGNVPTRWNAPWVPLISKEYKSRTVEGAASVTWRSAPL